MNFQYQRPTCVCGLNVCTTLPPLMSYRTHVESSWPVTKSRPEGSTVHAATGELQGMTFTQPRVRRSQNRAVLSYEDENAYVNYPLGPCTNDVSLIFGIFDPPPPVRIYSIEITQPPPPIVRNWLTPPPPLSTDVICTWPHIVLKIYST